MRIADSVWAGMLLALVMGCGRIGYDALGESSSDADAGQTVNSPIAWQEAAIGSVDVASLNSVTTSADLTGQSWDLFVAFVSIKRQSRPVDAVTGLGLTWTKLHQQCSARDTAGLALFWAQASGPVSGPITAELNSGATFTGSAVLSVHRFQGANPTTPMGAISWANTNGNDGNLPCSGGTDTDNYGWASLDTTAANSLVLVGIHTAKYGTHMAGPGYTELSDDQSGDNSDSAGIAVQEQVVVNPTSDLTVSGTFGDNPDWVAIAIEIRD